MTDCSSVSVNMTAPTDLLMASFLPLFRLPPEYKGQSAGVADIPQAWHMFATSPLPKRLSSNQQMIDNLARNFRNFLQLQNLALDQTLTRLFRLCNGPMEVAERDVIVGTPGNVTEQNISFLHSQTIKIIVPIIFNQLVQSHPRCQTLRDLGITVSQIVPQDPRSGVVDSCFTLNVPEQKDEKARSIHCCWFDDKNLAVFATHQAAIEKLIGRGARINFKNRQLTERKILVKVGPCLGAKKDCVKPYLRLRELIIRQSWAIFSASFLLGMSFSCSGPSKTTL